MKALASDGAGSFISLGTPVRSFLYSLSQCLLDTHCVLGPSAKGVITAAVNMIKETCTGPLGPAIRIYKIEKQLYKGP